MYGPYDARPERTVTIHFRFFRQPDGVLTVGQRCPGETNTQWNIRSAEKGYGIDHPYYSNRNVGGRSDGVEAAWYYSEKEQFEQNLRREWFRDASDVIADEGKYEL
jgi:hypothetical protein